MTGSKQINLDSRFIFNLLLLAAAGWFVLRIPGTLFTFGLGLLLYLLLDPLVGILEKYLKKRWLAITAVFTLFILLIVAVFSLVIPQAIVQLGKLLAQWPQIYDQLSRWLDVKTADLDASLSRIDPQLKGQVPAYVNNALNTIGTWLFNTLQSTVNFSMAVISRILSFFLALLISVYLLSDEKTVKNAIIQTFHMSPQNVDRMHFMIQHFNKTVNGYFRGMTYLSLIVFVLSWAFLSLVNVPYAFILAIWIGLTEYIPYLGPVMGAIPAILLGYLTSFALGNWVLLFLLVLQTIEANILAPKVLSKSLNIHPLVVFFALLAGGEAYGIVGMIIAAPAAAILITFFKVFRESNDPLASAGSCPENSL